MKQSKCSNVAAAAVTVMLLLGIGITNAFADDTWPCRQAGWEVGDQWGPGPEDIVPDVPICTDEPGASDVPQSSDEPQPSDELTFDVQAVEEAPAAAPVTDQTPPPTDT